MIMQFDDAVTNLIKETLDLEKESRAVFQRDEKKNLVRVDGNLVVEDYQPYDLIFLRESIFGQLLLDHDGQIFVDRGNGIVHPLLDYLAGVENDIKVAVLSHKEKVEQSINERNQKMADEETKVEEGSEAGEAAEATPADETPSTEENA